jgi:enoyl-CoA hydratase
VTARPHPALVEDRRDHIAVLRVDREERLGALSRAMVVALRHYVLDLAEDRDVRVFVLTGTGRGFVAGADVQEYHNVDKGAFDSYQRISREAFDGIERLPMPTIAAVNGYAFGGGFELALCCDLIVASTTARFALPEVLLGLLPGGGGTQRLSRAVGKRAAKELIMTGRHMSGGEARDRGLLARLVEPGELMTATMELAGTLAARPVLAVREAKWLIDDGVEAPLASALTFEQRVLSSLFMSQDAREGIAAFLEKRSPQFTGE